MPPVVLRLEGISKRFGSQIANDDISFALHQGEVIALVQGEADVVVGDLRPEALADAFEAQDDRRHAGQDDFGSPSSIFTSKLPSMMAASRSATSFIAASGTLPSKVPKGARELPPLRMKE